MKITLALSAFLATFAATVSAGERVGDFALIDHEGAFHHMAWYDDQKAIVLMPQAVGATDSASIQGLQALRTKYEDQGVVFFLINPGLQTDRAAVGEDLASLGLNLPVLMDDAQLVAEMLGLSHLDEAVVYDPSSFEMLYRGPVQDAMDLAIQQAIEGTSGDLVALATSGTPIEYANTAAHANLSYENDIAPIIAENCANCHREGGIAPFAMDSSLAVQGWKSVV